MHSRQPRPALSAPCRTGSRGWAGSDPVGRAHHRRRFHRLLHGTRPNAAAGTYLLPLRRGRGQVRRTPAPRAAGPRQGRAQAAGARHEVRLVAPAAAVPALAQQQSHRRGAAAAQGGLLLSQLLRADVRKVVESMECGRFGCRERHALAAQAGRAPAAAAMARL
eukprot:6201086-Pleurochrysis_carterae.AAC.1